MKYIISIIKAEYDWQEAVTFPKTEVYRQTFDWLDVADMALRINAPVVRGTMPEYDPMASGVSA